jgi:hypothetical protein
MSALVDAALQTVFERSNKSAPAKFTADDPEGLHPHPNKFVGNNLSKEEAETLGSVLSVGANQAGRRLRAWFGGRRLMA